MDKILTVPWLIEDPDGNFLPQTYYTEVPLEELPDSKECTIKTHIYNCVEEDFRNTVTWDLRDAISVYVGEAQNLLEKKAGPTKPWVSGS